MNFADVKKIYDQLKRENNDYNFVRDLFVNIREKFEQEARKAGKDPNQAWNSWSGQNFQRIIEYAVEAHIRESRYQVGMTSDSKLRKSTLPDHLEKVRANIEVMYEEHRVVPDADIILYDERNFQVIAVLSCKASLRERIAQAAYWKIKLQSSGRTRNILCYLISTDNDGDFIGEKKSRDRIIVEHGEIDGAYILRDIPESAKINFLFA